MKTFLKYIKPFFGNSFGILVNTSYAIIGLLSIFYLVLKREKRVAVYLWLLGISIAFMFLLKSVEIPEERIHFIEYGIVGSLLIQGIRSGSNIFFKQILLATFLVSLIGSLDEGIQFFLPDRVFDLRDILMNSEGGFLGILFTRFVIGL